MKKIKDVCPTAAEAVDALIRGLRKYPKHERFMLDMCTFGDVNDDGFCVGCAATCAVLEITSTGIGDEFVKRAGALNSVSRYGFSYWYAGFDPDDIVEFESAIDDLRLTWNVSDLIEYYYGDFVFSNRSLIEGLSEFLWEAVGAEMDGWVEPMNECNYEATIPGLEKLRDLLIEKKL